MVDSDYVDPFDYISDSSEAETCTFEIPGMLDCPEGRAEYNRVMIAVQKAKETLKKISKMDVALKPRWAYKKGDLTVNTWSWHDGNSRSKFINLDRQKDDIGDDYEIEWWIEFKDDPSDVQYCRINWIWEAIEEEKHLDWRYITYGFNA